MAARESIVNQMNNLKAALDEHDAEIGRLTDDSDKQEFLHSGVDAIRANINTLMIGDHCLNEILCQTGEVSLLVWVYQP